ncbi:hypothetical protein M9H77_24334 [Catharanthus roseus]|uniref:Uncharacterized protein n=1 Tax=Catharanthus roseus TaxID=4058 RepID=A0ACC0AZW4_CATRO|nr:hypothetical protein M9H77_24334 [Catharanthus roseus]
MRKKKYRKKAWTVRDEKMCNSYHMLNIDQNVLAKLTEMVKDEEVAQRHLGLKKIMDDLKKARQMVEEPGSNCLHYLRNSQGLRCACELVNWCQHLVPIQEEHVVIFWRKLEIGSGIPEEHHRDIESKIRDLTSLLQEISTGPISNVREGSRSGSNPSPRGRGRPSHSGRSRGRGRSSGRSSLSTVISPDSPPVPFPFKNTFLGFMYQFIQNWKNVVGDGNCDFRVVSNFLFGDENHWVEIPRRMSYDLRHRMHVYEQLFGSVERVTELIMKTYWEEGSTSPEYWMNTPDHLYVIANTFNLCIVFLARSESTTVLPLVSNMDGHAGTIFIGLIEELQHFI